MLTTADFEREISALIERASRQGRPHVEINAGELHRVVGGYPDPSSHRMPMACSAMRKLMSEEDQEIFAPERGAGASLTIRYVLPR